METLSLSENTVKNVDWLVSDLVLTSELTNHQSRSAGEKVPHEFGFCALEQYK